MGKRQRESLNGADWFLWGELILYLGFLTLDLGVLDTLRTGNGKLPNLDFLSCILKYTSVLVCYLWRVGKKDTFLERAQLLVLGADLCLLFRWHAPMGVALFLGVQLQYRQYLKDKRAWKGFLLQCGLAALAAGLLMAVFLSGAAGTSTVVFVSGPEGISSAAFQLPSDRETMSLCLLGTVYGVALLSNLYLAWREKQTLFGAGLFLLLLCDIHVLLYNLPLPLGGLLGQWQELAGTGMWFFYLPSQLVIAKLAVRKGKVYS